jgi:hypothetical protein
LKDVLDGVYFGAEGMRPHTHTVACEKWRLKLLTRFSSVWFICNRNFGDNEENMGVVEPSTNYADKTDNNSH